MTSLIERLRLAKTSSPLQQNAVCIRFKSIMPSPPFSKSLHTTFLFTFSKALRLQSFFRHKTLNNNLFTCVRRESGTTSACMIYTSCEIKNVFYDTNFTNNAQVSFFPCINYPLNVFHPSRPALFNLRSTFITGKVYAKYF